LLENKSKVTNPEVSTLALPIKKDIDFVDESLYVFSNLNNVYFENTN
jgi:hypothetical protein